MDAAALVLFERSLRHATTTRHGAELDAELVELGWPDALAEDRRGAISTLFELQGAANTTSSSIGTVLSSALGDPFAVPTVLPPVPRWEPPATVGRNGLQIDGLATVAAADRAHLTVVATADHAPVACRVPTESLDLRPVGGIDPAIGLLHVAGRDVAVLEQHPLAAGQWDAAVALGRLAVAHELAGACRTMLALAREHALERVQFGRPISSFQAVRHRLAESLVAIESADALIDAAWIEESTANAAMAKALAGRSARTVARHSQQVLAGIGFTTEHSLHRYIRRVLVLEALLGSASAITAAQGDEILGTGVLPPLLPL